MKLVKPSTKYADSFWRGLRAFRKRDKKAFTEYGTFTNGEEFVKLVNDHVKGKRLPPKWKPYRTYWLVEGGAVIGQCQVRNFLTKHLRDVGGQIGYGIFPAFRRRGYGKLICALALKKFFAQGGARAIITCDATNTGSRKIIEANGGVLMKRTHMGGGEPDKLVFIVLK